MRVLISGARAPVALELLRIFSDSCHEVDIADSCSYPVARFSRRARKYYRIPSPRFHYPEFKAAILLLHSKRRYDLIIPTCDEVFYFSKLKKEENLAAIFCDDLDKITALNNKWSLAQMAQDWPIKTPASFLLNSKEDWVRQGLSPEHFDLQPVSSNLGDRRWIAQEHIQGQEISVYAVCVHGNLKAFSAYKPRYHAGNGPRIFLEPHFDPKLFDFCSDFAKRTMYHGQVSFDFVFETESSTHWLLTCNPHSASGLHFFDQRLSYYIFDTAPGVLKPACHEPKMIASAMITYGLPRSVRPEVWRKFFRDFRQAGDIVWNRRDPLPALGQYLAASTFLLKGLFFGVSARSASTRDIEFES